METFKSGELVGTGSAINVQIGWIPTKVTVVNVTDGNKITIGFPKRYIIPFSDGGTNVLAAGDTIEGATSGATGVIATVLLYSGTWAAGTAAGFFVMEPGIVGTFQSENVVGEASGATDDATVTVQVTHSVDIDTEVAGVTGNSAIAPYAGTAAANSKGFTLGSSVSTDNKLFRWGAWRDDR